MLDITHTERNVMNQNIAVWMKNHRLNMEDLKMLTCDGRKLTILEGVELYDRIVKLAEENVHIKYSYDPKREHCLKDVPEEKVQASRLACLASVDAKIALLEKITGVAGINEAVSRLLERP
ncbi:MAG: hypothetical protein LBL79_06000 [Prevotella sp.]|jgi:hypothetical protein|nr:hypothetical protein [Prevotella sp.]